MKKVSNFKGYDFYTGVINGEKLYNIIPEGQQPPNTGYPSSAYISKIKGFSSAVFPSIEESFAKLQAEFITVHEDEKGYYVSGGEYDYRYIKAEAKKIGVCILLFNPCLQSDDSARYYFTIQ